MSITKETKELAEMIADGFTLGYWGEPLFREGKKGRKLLAQAIDSAIEAKVVWVLGQHKYHQQGW